MFVDTGPMVALVNARDPFHARAKAALKPLPKSTPLHTVWPCFTEAMYFLGEAGGLYAQDALWKFLYRARMTIRNPAPAEIVRMEALMRKYADLPMDLADAGIVAGAEATGDRRVFTFDTHFYAYRLADDSPLDVVP